MLHVDLYGDPTSQPTVSVLWLCRLGAVPHTFHLVDLEKSENRAAEYTRRFPTQLVPAVALRDGDAVVAEFSESGAILTTIATQFASLREWYPAELGVRASIDEYMFWHASGTRKLSDRLVWPYWLHHLGKIDAGERDRQFDGGLKDVQGVLDLLETWLTGREFLRGNRPTIADLVAYPEFVMVLNFGLLSLDARPTLRAWMQRMRAGVDHADVFASFAPLAKDIVGPFPQVFEW